MPDEKPLTLNRCDEGPHHTRQRIRLVRLRAHDGDGTIDERVVALCTDHYRELRHSLEPRHDTK